LQSIIFIFWEDFKMASVSRLTSITAYDNQSKYFATISNNLTNAQTPGFKRDIPLFRPLLEQGMGSPRYPLISETRTLFHQGDLHQTGNALDLAIDGDGFFKVRTPNGLLYTRAGNFKLNEKGVLINANGFPVMGRAGEIVLKGKAFMVRKDGTVEADGGKVDQIAVVTFPDPGVLKKEGQNLFRLESSQEGKLGGGGVVLQGTLEASNVNPIEEMVKLIDSLRTYESCLKMIQSQDELDSKAANEVGRV
jgi:flagellar basal-body rod protein FlgF